MDGPELLAYYDQLARRERCVPSWVRSVYTGVPCELSPEREVALLAEFLWRFGDVLQPLGRTHA